MGRVYDRPPPRLFGRPARGRQRLPLRVRQGCLFQHSYPRPLPAPRSDARARRNPILKSKRQYRDMFPMRMSSVFKSRWMALVWAAGIIWAAYDFAGSQPDDENATANSEQVAAALNTF